MSLPRINVTIPGISTQGDSEDGSSSLFPDMTFKERLIGFGTCVIVGFLISFSSFGSFSELLVGRPVRFAILYSLGNLTSLCSTLFLVGVKQQFRNMTKSHRRVSAGIYVFCLIMTLLTAFFVPELKWLIVALVLTQWTAFFWYSLSYIPFGRRIATGLANRLLV